MADNMRGNNFNDESIAWVGVRLDFSDLPNDLKTTKKAITSFAKENKIDIEVEKKSIKEIEDVESKITELEKELEKLQNQKVSRSTFNKYKNDFLARFDEIEANLEGVKKTIEEIIKKSPELGKNINLSNMINQCKQARDVLVETSEAVDKVSNINNGQDIKLGISNEEIKAYKEAREELKKANNDFRKAAKEDFEETFARLGNRSLQDLSSYYKELAKESSIVNKEVAQLLKLYNEAPEDSDIIPLAKLQAAQLRLSSINQEAKNVFEVVKKIVDESKVKADKNDNTKILNIEDFLNPSIMAKATDVIDKILGKQNAFKAGAKETYESLSKIIRATQKNENIPSTEKNAEKTLDTLEKTTNVALRLNDLLVNNKINIVLDGDIEALKTKIENQIESLQSELNKEALIIPIKVSIDSSKVGDALKDNEDKDLSTTVASIDKIKAEVKKAEKEAKKTDSKAKEIFIDLGKVTSKSTASILKVIENAVNKFVQDVKDALDSIFSETRNVRFELNSEDVENAKKILQADSLVNQDTISENLKYANEVAKELIGNLKEILGLFEEENKSSFGLTTSYKSSKNKKFDYEGLMGDLKKYKKEANSIKKYIQEEIFKGKPVYLELDIKDNQLTKVREKVENAEIGTSLTKSLTRAESIAESVVEILSQLNGLDIKVTNGKGETGQNDIIFILKGLKDIVDELQKINTAISGIKLTPVDSQLQIVETDFTEITKKFDELMSKSGELVNELKISLETIQVSIENLGKTLDKALDEKNIHTVVDELNGIDLSTLENSLSHISDELLETSKVINKIADTIKQMDDNSLESQWRNIAEKFNEISNATGNIDLRKSKKQVQEIIDLYAKYKKSGGLNSLDSLTDNASTLEKFQKLATATHGSSLTIVDNDKLKETREQLQELNGLLSSITVSLTSINGLENVSKVFNALNINDNTLNKITILPEKLKIISDKIRELDQMPYSGFIEQLTKITAQADGLKALAEVLKKSNKQINAALDLMEKEPNDVYKALMGEIDATKEYNKLFSQYSKRGSFETSQPKEYADVLELIKEKLKEIEDIRSSHLKDSKTEAATIGQIYDRRKVADINDELHELFNWLEDIKTKNNVLTNQLNEEFSITKKFAKQFEKISEGGGTKERSYSPEYVNVLREIQKILKDTQKYQNLKVTDEASLSNLKNLNEQLETLFRTLQSISTYANDTDTSLSSRMIEATKAAKKYERDYYSRWGYGKIPTEYGSEYGNILNQIKSKVEEIQRLGELKTISEADVERAEKLNSDIGLLFQELVKVNKVAKETQITNLQNKIASYIEKNTRLTTGMYASLTNLFERLSNGAELTDVQLKEIAADFNRIQYSAKVAGLEGTGFLDAIRNKLKYGWAQSIAMFFSFYDIVRYIREVSNAITEINTNLIELAKVSDASIGQLYGDFKDFYDIAKDTGGTINDIIQATANWSRNGYNLPDSKSLARVSSIFQNIGDGMTADQSNEYLVSILKGFDIKAEDSMQVLDILNNVSNNAASSVQDLGEALERSSSAFGASNTSLSESVALLTKANEILQNPENVGTAFKSMSARLRAADTEIESLEDGFTMTTSKLRGLVQALTGFDIQETEDSYKSIYQILLGIGKEWNNLTDLEQASLSEELFGKRNSQVGFAILNNIKRLEEIYDLAEHSTGSAMEEQQKYLEGVSYQFDIFTASVEKLANTFMSSDFLKGAIKSGTTFINILDNIIENLGTIPTLIGTIATVVGAKWNVLYDIASLGYLKENSRTLPLTTNTDINTLAAAGNAQSINTLIEEYKVLGTQASKTQMSLTQFNSKLAEGNTLFGQYILSLDEGAIPSLKGYQKYVVSTTAKTLALRSVTMLLQGALFTIAGLIITKVVTAISDWVHANERAIETGEEAQKTISDINDTLNTQQKTIQDSAKRFAELSQGVDQLTGKNLSLSDEDYKEFLDISNKLAEVFPTLSKHYDENGNAIVDLDGDVNTITSSLKSLLEVEEKLAQQKILDNASQIFDEAVAKNKKLVEDGLYVTTDDSQLLSKYKEALDFGGINNEIYGVLSGEGGSIQIEDISEITRENINKIAETYGKEVPELIKQLNDIQKEALSNYQSLSSVLATYLYSEYDFAKLSPELQAGVQNLVNNLDWTALDFHSWEEATSWIMDNIVRKIGNDDTLSKTFELSLEANTIFNNGEISVGEYQKKIKDLLPLLEGLDDETRKSIELVLGLEFDSDGNIINTQVNNLTKQLESFVGEESAKAISEGLTKGELEAVQNSSINWGEILNKNQSLDTQIQVVKQKIASISQVPFEINLDRDTIVSTAEGIGEIQSLYQSLYDSMEDGKVGEELALQFADVEALEEKLGNVSQYQDIWDNFYDTVTDGSHSFEEMEDALNQVLTAYVNATIDLSNFDKAQADAISTQLQLAGVTKESADKYVQTMVVLADAKKVALEAGYDLDKELNQEAIDYILTAEMSEQARQALAAYALQKQITNGITITTSASCQNLYNLATAAGVAKDKLVRLAELQADLKEVEEKIASGEYTATVGRDQIKGIKQTYEMYMKEDIIPDIEDVLNKPFEFDSSKLKSSGGSSGKKEKDPWKEAYEKELAELDHLHEMELISDIQYYEKREELNDKYFKDREKYTEEYNKNLEEIYKGFQSAYKQYVDDMTDYWQKSLNAGQISFAEYCENMKSMLNTLHDAGKIDDETYYEKMADYYGSIVENYDKAISAGQRLIKKQIESLNKQKDSIEKSYKEQIDAVQQEIDKLKEANEERQKELDLQKALYDLNRAENQRTQYTYTSDQGFVYKAKEQDLKDAQEEVEQTQYEMYISTLEKKISTLETEMENLTSAIDDQIDKLQDYSDRLGETANKWKEAHEDMVAASVWGSDWQTHILECDEELLKNFTSDYINMQQEQADYAVLAANKKVDAYNKEIEAINALKEAQQNANKTSGVSKLENYSLSSDNSKKDNSKKKTPKTNKAIKYAYKDSKGNVKYVYGEGTESATPGYHEIAEDGDEIVLDNYGNAYIAKGHQLHKFEGGEKVFDASETKELLNGKYLPIESLLPNYSDMLNKVVSSGIMSTSISSNSMLSTNKNLGTKPDISNSINITIGDIHVTEVDNATDLAKAITNKLPNALLQELNRK